MTRWHESDNPGTVVRGAGWRLLVLILCILLVSGLISIGYWFFFVKTSDIKGAGDAERNKNSATNRVRAQEEYVQTYNDILAADKRVNAMWQAKEDDPSTINKTNYNGAVNFCIQLIADYDALIDKYTSADFIPEGYPEKIDQLDKETDCKENVK